MWDILENIRQYDLQGRTINAVEDFVLMVKSFTAQLDKLNAYENGGAHIGKTTKLDSGIV